ncbi:MAG TPA: tRNA 2-thiouridine(34) synthase MnmA [Anaerolineae bacterium]|nr:tRNA 2-thiouridine(34) synthase MnmA [Anaerolineae bacterium]HQI87552.1 tRNA 2-thiouridine(34) synthase MnmA [Anaerolineae bacterium]
MTIGHSEISNHCVVIGMSGGVDSAVAAALLQEQGFAVQGVTLKTWHTPFTNAEVHIDLAAAVAEALHIPLHIEDVEARFYRDVVEPFVAEYVQGHTPNPCVMCNPTLKFAVLLEAADRLGARWIATGHYARIAHPEAGPARLLQAHNRQKDQSYALYRLTQRHLTRLLLPLGDIADKAAVRAMARRLSLPSADAEDSQDLCFMRGGDYRELLSHLRPEAIQPGPIFDESGKRLGEHHGLPYYTIGQRSGLGIAAAEPLYVLRLRSQDNAVIVGPASSLAQEACTLVALTFTTGAPPAEVFSAQGRIRYRAPRVDVTVRVLDAQRAAIHFAQPQRGVAPGQSLALYQDEEVIGGGIIAELDTQA